MLRFLKVVFCLFVAAIMILCFFADKNNLGLADAGQAVIQNTEEGRWPLEQSRQDRVELDALFALAEEESKSLGLE